MNNRLSRHFAACAVAAAGVAVLGAAQKSDAALVYSGIQNIAAPATTAGLYLNLITGDNGVTPGDAPGWHINPWSSSVLRFGTNYPVPDVYFCGTTSSGTAVNLNAGSFLMFDGSANNASTMNGAYGWSFSSSAVLVGAPAGQWKVNSDNYVGVLSFENATDVLIGWVRMHVGATILDRTVVDWAYDIGDGSQVVEVGAVPAPGALALVGLAGFAARRRRA
ncbi:MAG: hypothetical protein K8R92_12055 [Planctomycetes bacterium]|nr:hypothetical protein [Planctomycetota bacterium]